MTPSGRSGRRVSPGSLGHAPAGGYRPAAVAGSDQRVSSRGAGPAPAPPAAEANEGIRGRVVTSGHQAVGAATVAISAGPPHPDMAALTDDSGEFLLDVSPGQYEVTVHKQGYLPATVGVGAPASRPVTIVLHRAG